LACSGVTRDALVAMSGVTRDALVATSGVRRGAEVAKPHQNNNQDLTWGAHRKQRSLPFICSRITFRNNSGSLAMLTAILRGSSLLSSLAGPSNRKLYAN
jgi:hypothetical protein